ncbi:MAG: amino acid ABC transporter substrate-binding protein [Ruminococcaceae bacterium]|nr:amino acid ABC transporter substrate-binding protein [Oscillospiraceae bacterium]
MKKILALLSALTLTLAFASCGDSTANNSSTGDNKTGSSEVVVSEANSEASSEDTTAKTTLIMGTNATFPPYEYVEGDKIVGIDAEIAAKIAEKLGMTLEIQDMDFDAILGSVQTGKIDFGMAGMTVTEDRLKSVNFTTFYAKGVQVVIVKDGGKVASLDDLAKDGILIGVQQNTTGDIFASDDYGTDKVVQYKNGPDATAALVAGKIDAVIIDKEPAKSYVAANTGLSILDASYADEDYAICVAKDNDELLNKINTALEELIADGTVKAIIDKYIPAN